MVEGHGENDSRILELSLICHETDPPLPEIDVESKLGSQCLLDPDVVNVLPRRRDQDEAVSQRA